MVIKEDKSRESAVDDLVVNLLESLGFSNYHWIVRSRRESALLFGGIEKEAVADVSVVDISSDNIVRLCVVEDKSYDKEEVDTVINNAEAQLLAEGIAAAQQNKDYSQMYMLRVVGQNVTFYYGDLKRISEIVKKGEETLEKTQVKRLLFRSKLGHDLIDFEERNVIITVLDLIHQLLLSKADLKK